MNVEIDQVMESLEVIALKVIFFVHEEMPNIHSSMQIT